MIAASLYVIIVLAFAMLKDSVALDNTSSIQSYLQVLSGFVLILPAIIVAQTISHEFKDNAIRTTLILFPKRLNTLLTKLLSGTIVSLSIVLAAAVIIVLLAVIKGGGGVDAGLIASLLGRQLIGVVAILSMVFALALIFKQTIIAVLLPTIILGIFEGILALSLKIESNYLVTTSLKTFTDATSGNWLYLGTYLVYLAIFFTIGLVLFRNKDF